jgi:hypothetical protein
VSTERLEALTVALAEVLREFGAATTLGGSDYLIAVVPALRLDGWHRVLELADTDVAGADVTPDPAAPATTTT